jgi:hypothetical protein
VVPSPLLDPPHPASTMTSTESAAISLRTTTPKP